MAMPGATATVKSTIGCNNFTRGRYNDQSGAPKCSKETKSHRSINLHMKRPDKTKGKSLKTRKILESIDNSLGMAVDFVGMRLRSNHV